MRIIIIVIDRSNNNFTIKFFLFAFNFLQLFNWQLGLHQFLNPPPPKKNTKPARLFSLLRIELAHLEPDQELDFNFISEKSRIFFFLRNFAAKFSLIKFIYFETLNAEL